MRECARLIRAEFYKMRGIHFYLIHALIACFGAFLFLVYYGYHDFAPEKEWAWYIETVSIVFPVMISIVCVISVRVEEKNHFLTLLKIAVRKRNSLLAKWAVLSVTGLFAVTAAVGGFFIVRQVIERKCVGFGKLCLETILILWICSQGMYLLHLCVCLRWSGNISMCIGVLESMLAALLQTGLGDGIWQFFLCAWGGRYTSCLLLYSYVHGGTDFRMSFRSETLDKIAVPADLSGNLTVSVCVVTIWIIGAFVWFHYFEGRRLDD